MRRPPAPLLAATLAAAWMLAGCGGGDGTGPTPTLPAALVGNWQAGPTCRAAGCAITARVEGSGTVIPLTDSVSLTMDVRSTGGVLSTLSLGNQAPRTLLGTGRTRGDTLIIDYSSTPSDTIVFATQGALLRFDFQNVLQLDVTGDGNPERLRIGVLFARR